MLSPSRTLVRVLTSPIGLSLDIPTSFTKDQPTLRFLALPGHATSFVTIPRLGPNAWRCCNGHIMTLVQKFSQMRRDALYGEWAQVFRLGANPRIKTTFRIPISVRYTPIKIARAGAPSVSFNFSGRQ